MSSVDRVSAAVLAVVSLVSCGACRQHWEFARAEEAILNSSVSGASESDVAAGGVFPAGGAAPGLVGGRSAGPTFGRAAEPIFEPPAEPVFNPPAAVRYDRADVPGRSRSRLGSMLQETSYHIRSDYRHYYCWITMRDLLLGISAGSVLANTSMDQDFRDWYQDDVRNSDTDNFTSFWKPFGRAELFVPAFVGLGLVGGLWEDRPLLRAGGEFGDRVTRGYLVGAPPMVFMQFCLGASRPEEADVESRWKPFDDGNAVSGHAFTGAVPLITAARMVENPWAKGCLYICSTFPAWSRVNDDAHYLSQACLGWWMAYLACRSVDQTEDEERYFTLTPLVAPEMAGVGVVVRR